MCARECTARRPEPGTWHWLLRVRCASVPHSSLAVHPASPLALWPANPVASAAGRASVCERQHSKAATEPGRRRSWRAALLARLARRCKLASPLARQASASEPAANRRLRSPALTPLRYVQCLCFSRHRRAGQASSHAASGRWGASMPAKLARLPYFVYLPQPQACSYPSHSRARPGPAADELSQRSCLFPLLPAAIMQSMTKTN